MALNQAYAQYNKGKIMTASGAELTLLLYEGAIKFCNIALLGLEQNDIMKTHVNIKKVEDIIMELQSTLNRKYPVAEDFDRIYKYIIAQTKNESIETMSAPPVTAITR